MDGSRNARTARNVSTNRGSAGSKFGSTSRISSQSLSKITAHWASATAAEGNVAAILPSIAANDLRDAGVREVSVGFLKCFDREMCLASNVRMARIRPILQYVGT